MWLDALVNYLTVSGHPLPGHTWPPTEQVVGKDILRFHAIFWPAFLLAAGLELPRKIVTHSHWVVDKTKVSVIPCGCVVYPYLMSHVGVWCTPIQCPIIMCVVYPYPMSHVGVWCTPIQCPMWVWCSPYHLTLPVLQMSKSKGNVVDPLEQFSLFGMEQVRYYLLKEGFLHHDGGTSVSVILGPRPQSPPPLDYSIERLASVVNSDLANTLGNLLQRITSKQLSTSGTGSRLQYRRDLFPLHEDDNSGSASKMDCELINHLHELPGTYVADVVLIKMFQTFVISAREQSLRGI